MIRKILCFFTRLKRKLIFRKNMQKKYHYKGCVIMSPYSNLGKKIAEDERVYKTINAAIKKLEKLNKNT